MIILTTLFINSVNVSVNIQEKILDLAHACIRPKLCEKIGHTKHDDYLRGKIEPYDFEENSVMNKVLRQKYPNLLLPDPKDKNAIGIQVIAIIILNLLF